MFEDFVVEDIAKNVVKKIKSGRKGKRGERMIVDVFNTRFNEILTNNPSWGAFSRTVGSGNRLTQRVRLSENAQQLYASDIVCPTNFKFVIESKNGYDDIDLFLAFGECCKQLDQFLEQVTTDANKVNRQPLLIWKKTRKPTIAFLYPEIINHTFSTRFYYKNWIGIPFEELLNNTDDSFWFHIS